MFLVTRVMYGINSFQLNWNVVLNYFAVFRFVEIISLLLVTGTRQMTSI